MSKQKKTNKKTHTLKYNRNSFWLINYKKEKKKNKTEQKKQQQQQQLQQKQQQQKQQQQSSSSSKTNAEKIISLRNR